MGISGEGNVAEFKDECRWHSFETRKSHVGLTFVSFAQSTLLALREVVGSDVQGLAISKLFIPLVTFEVHCETPAPLFYFECQPKRTFITVITAAKKIDVILRRLQIKLRCKRFRP